MTGRNSQTVDLLGLPTMRATGSDAGGGNDFTTIRVEITKVTTACLHCGKSALIGHGVVEQAVIDTPTHGKPTKLVIARRRLLCAGCGKTFFEEAPDIDPKRLATRRLVEFVEQHGLRLTFMEVARQTGLDNKTVRNIVDGYREVLETTHKPTTPVCLGIDEAKIGGLYRGVITNVQANTFVDLLEGRTRAQLDAYFDKMPDKDRVEVVVTDLWNAYRQMAYRHFPKAEVVADKFHVMRMAGEAVEFIRKHIRKQQLAGKVNERDRLKLKDQRFLLLKRQSELTARELVLLNDIKDKYPLLAIAQETKEGFFAVYDAPDRKTAEAMFEEWKASMDPQVAGWFKRLAYDVDNWHRHVFTVFDLPYTNGYTESFNRFIKDVNRFGRGYSFPILRARLLYNNLAKIEERTVVRKRVKFRVPPTGPSGAVEQWGFVDATRAPAPTRTEIVEEVETRWLGAHIPTICDLLEKGYFE